MRLEIEIAPGSELKVDKRSRVASEPGDLVVQVVIRWITRIIEDGPRLVTSVSGTVNRLSQPRLDAGRLAEYE